MNNPSHTPPQLMRLRDVAKALALSQRVLWAATKAGRLPVIRFGRSIRYDPKDVAAFVDAHRKGGRP